MPAEKPRKFQAVHSLSKATACFHAQRSTALDRHADADFTATREPHRIDSPGNFREPMMCGGSARHACYILTLCRGVKMISDNLSQLKWSSHACAWNITSDFDRPSFRGSFSLPLPFSAQNSCRRFASFSYFISCSVTDPTSPTNNRLIGLVAPLTIPPSPLQCQDLGSSVGA